MKICPKCTLELENNSFNKNIRKKDGLQTYCRNCQKQIDKKFYPKRDITEKLKKEKIRRILVNNFKVNYLKEHPCFDCNNSDIRVLEFHHIYKRKDFNLGESNRYCLNRVKDEIEKCIVLCANCHRIRHYNNINLTN